MSLIGIFYGSDTGNTQKIAEMIQEKLGADIADVYDIAKATQEDMEKYNLLLLGIPTWYYGEAQADWEDAFPIVESIDFSERVVGIFGCGDQDDYGKYFCDAMGTLGELVQKQGATLIGFTSTEGYHFEESKACIGPDTFIGLCIDEDRQSELTDTRVTNWVNQIKSELSL